MPSTALKMQRAALHLAEIEQHIMAYLQSEPYQLSVETDRSTSSYVVSPSHHPPSEDIALCLGDFIHNLRSALDHLARCMVQENGGTPVDGPRGTTFPILRSAKAELINVTGGISMARREILQEVQPFHLGTDYEQHALWKLNELDNIDKHRVLQLVSFAGASSVAFFPEGIEDVTLTPSTNRYSIPLDSIEPQRIVVAEDDLHDRAQARGMHTTTVRMDVQEFCGGENVWALCHGLYDYVRNDVILRLVAA